MRGPAGISELVDSGVHPPTRSPRFRRAVIVIVIVAIIILLVGAALLYSHFAPFSERSVAQDLSEASDSTVTIGGYRQTYFPSPGCVLENVEFRHGPDHAKFIAVDTLRIQGSYIGMLWRQVPRITAIGAHVFIPKFGSVAPFQTESSKTIVEELLVRNAVVEFAPETAGESPLLFEVHEAALKNVRTGGTIAYQLKFHNPNPPGEISVGGNFGPWPPGNPPKIPLSGTYAFDQANLGVYEGIGGLLSSAGKFDGVLEHVNITGETEVPDFYVKSGGHKVRLATHFDAYVDAMHGDTFLKHVEAHFGRSTIIAHGSIARSPGRKGKFARLELIGHKGRIEDILGLFVTAPRPPMSGPVALQSRVEIPPGEQPFLKKISLEGAFGIDEGSFTKPDTQHDVNVLSAGARGEHTDSKEDPETVMTELNGKVTLHDGTANFADLSFFVPGAHARLHGTYNLLNYRIALHGRMRVDTKISKTSSGVKALFLKVMDPFFKKKKKGEVVPVHILGTYEKPQFGLDITNPNEEKPASK